mmetsp:Transcript_73133/g.201823  ORF Transcript_73133/g.201823 Transcript_73133/m.201823 type:complete len:532 (-) Transcript_73133:245-1840(-)|eukprot:CAMPEP_0179151510 /NCGR_PEP_ID=MMETSP0796-20121207/73563_1 /TAXON_ID=73915 /ORGANISM="Pyrodinium bahamense, Strain pbaha01" /LENGTH=531 /DNA_ID=CAMNT_0020852615 /DNA_START=45 /DNA_END=1640 /DNA_ORIENTATION=+
MSGPQVANSSAEQQSFHGLVRLLTEAHDLEVSALQAKIAELERSAAPGQGGGSRRFAETPDGTADADIPIGTPGTPRPHLPGGREPDPREAADSDYVDSMMRALESAPTPSSPALQTLGCCSRLSRLAIAARHLVHWPGFDFCVGAVIMVNSIFIGIELEVDVVGHDPGALVQILQILEVVFLLIYTLELALRVLADGMKCFRDNWVKFDAVLLFVGCCSELLDEITHVWDGLDHFIVVRGLRLLRLFRAARMMGRWKTLWRLVSGVVGGVETLVSTFIVLLFAVYIFTCVSMELISKDNSLKADPVTEQVIQDYFNNFGSTVITTFQFVVMDGASDISRPLIKAHPWLAVYFLLIFAFLPILLMNLVTAVLVDDAISGSQMDEKIRRRERKEKVNALIPELRRAFQILDVDQSGQVHMEDILSANFAQMPGVDGVSHLLTRDAMVELYEVFDTDGSGFISEEELVSGLTQLAMSESSLEIAEVKNLVKASAQHVRSVKLGVERIVTLLEGGNSDVRYPSVPMRTTGHDAR